MLIGDFLRNSAARAPDRVALIGRGKRITYAEFEQDTNRLANALAGLGLNKGAKVAILSSNCPEYAIALDAALGDDKCHEWGPDGSMDT